MSIIAIYIYIYTYHLDRSLRFVSIEREIAEFKVIDVSLEWIDLEPKVRKFHVRVALLSSPVARCNFEFIIILLKKH